MPPFSGAVSEMKSFKTKNRKHGMSRADVERLLSADALSNEQGGRLSEIVEALSSAGEPAPSEEEVKRFASQAASLVPVGAEGSGSLSNRVVAAPWRRRRRLVMRLTATAAALLVVLSGFGGLAYAADGSIPGDSLYGVDLALEKIGIGDGGLKERLNEASEMVARGRAQEGLDLASDAIAQSVPDDEGLRAAADSLRAATEAAVRNQNLRTTEELDQTAERLQIMASEDKTAEELGDAVNELAGSLDPQGGGNGGGGGMQDQGGTTDTTDTDVGGSPKPGDGSGTGDSPGGMSR